jgi:endonuclease/exonuclease/phosphatase family metal-dependent hydrolase
VRLASFNLLHGRSVSDGAVDVARLHEAVTVLAADVLGVQEVDRGQSRSHGLDLTREVAQVMGVTDWRFAPALIGTPGFDWRVADDADQASGEPSYGCGLVSRYPVRSWHTIRLRAAGVRSPIMLPGTRRVVWLRDEPRVGVAAVIDGPFGVMTVAATHLSFVPLWNVVQLRRLCSWLGRLPGPRVLLGDLNMPPPFPARLTGWRELARAATYPTTDPRFQLDHILGSGELPPVRCVESPALAVSDHRALLVEL